MLLIDHIGYEQSIHSITFSSDKRQEKDAFHVTT